MRFVHTADWQLGKPFGSIEDDTKRILLQQARLDVIARIGDLACEHDVDFVLVAGDLFDSRTVSWHVVSAACSAIGAIQKPVLVIPGNHDHGGTAGIWQQEFFLRESEALAPNLTVLLDFGPFELDSAIILPCPLVRRSVQTDPTEWLRQAEEFESLDPSKPRIVLAHGSVEDFSGDWQDDEELATTNNFINLSRLPEEQLDYIALGDWHGTKQINTKAWYSGTPETDRFRKGGEHDPGNILVVEAERGQAPRVTRIETGALNWNEIEFDMVDEHSLEHFKEKLENTIGQRTNKDLLSLTLTGSVGMDTARSLEELRESMEARLLRLKWSDKTQLEPTAAEIEGLTARHSDPLISRVASRLFETAQRNDDQSKIAWTALRELHHAVMRGDQA